MNDERCIHVHRWIFGSPVCGRLEGETVHQIPNPDSLSHRFEKPERRLSPVHSEENTP